MGLDGSRELILLAVSTETLQPDGLFENGNVVSKPDFAFQSRREVSGQGGKGKGKINSQVLSLFFHS